MHYSQTHVMFALNSAIQVWLDILYMHKKCKCFKYVHLMVHTTWYMKGIRHSIDDAYHTRGLTVYNIIYV